MADESHIANGYGGKSDARDRRGEGRPLTTPISLPILGPARFALDRLLAELAGRQHGVVALRQLIERGANDQWVRRRVGAGRLHRLHRGVYAVGHRKLSRRGRLIAAVLAGGPGSSLAGPAAAELWGLIDYSRTVLDVIVPRHRRSRGILRFHRSHLPVDERRARDGIPVTSTPRTLLDVAAVLDRHQVARAMERADARQLYDRLSLPDLLARYPRRPGTPSIRLALSKDHAFARTRSGFEEEFLSFLERRGFPRPLVNTQVHCGAMQPEVDCLWPHERVVVELDDFSTHGGRQSFAADRQRDRLLRIHGYEPTRVVPDDIGSRADGFEWELWALLRRKREAS